MKSKTEYGRVPQAFARYRSPLRPWIEFEGAACFDFLKRAGYESPRISRCAGLCEMSTASIPFQTALLRASVILEL
jgi:hypothetical protein